MSGSSTKGRLLLATPPLLDPNFDRTVIYVLEHNDEGALGLVVNRPTGETDVEGLDMWCDLLTSPAVVFSGGPVEVGVVIGLAWYEPTHPTTLSMTGLGISIVDLHATPTEVAPLLERFRIFRGYSGWSPGQLDAELDGGAWIVVSAVVDDVFCGRPDGLWREVLRRQGGRLAWAADAPDDLSAN